MDCYVSEEGILLVKWYKNKEVISGTNHYYLLVPLGVHNEVLWQEVNATSSLSRKAAPNHEGVRVLHSLGCEARAKRLEPLGLLTLDLITQMHQNVDLSLLHKHLPSPSV
jgi:hypothetical protein